VIANRFALEHVHSLWACISKVGGSFTEHTLVRSLKLTNSIFVQTLDPHFYAWLVLCSIYHLPEKGLKGVLGEELAWGLGDLPLSLGS
jgi:hypothetical protein